MKKEVETKVRKEKDAKVCAKPLKVGKQQSEAEIVAAAEISPPQVTFVRSQ